eukprot:snap_masked-scaffold_54-processed-gene-1.34-mRNA-1 protein AED:1.00 eAED:1.00 QI:0/-1/0/0/-1/1/1/0/219
MKFSQSSPAYVQLPQNGKAANQISEYPPPELRPDTFAGLFCPTGTIYSHETANPVFKKKLVKSLAAFFEVTTLFALLVSFCNWFSTLSDEEKKDTDIAIFDTSYSEEYKMFQLFNRIFLLWHVGIRVFFFCFYVQKVKQQEFRHPRESISIISVLLFPLATIYHHEENNLCGWKMIRAYIYKCFLGHIGLWFYTLVCYKPTYQQKKEMHDILREHIEQV